MEKVYKSKIGLELVIPLGLVFGTLLIVMLSGKTSWIDATPLLLVIIFVAHLFMTTYYVIAQDKLRVKCSFFINKTIEIKSITKITETNNPLSAPATSLDRLEICYGKFDSILISPKHKKTFIEELLHLNPSIQVILK